MSYIKIGQDMNIKLILMGLIFLTASVDASVVVAPDDANILYTGRWDQSNASQPWARAKGTSIIAKFHGTSLSATFSASTTEYLRIFIDDAPGEDARSCRDERCSCLCGRQ